MIYTGVEPTLITLFGGDAQILGRVIKRKYPRAARTLMHLSPMAQMRLRVALHSPTPGRIQALRGDPELMGIWPLVAKAAAIAAKLGAKGIKGIAKRVKSKRKAKKAKAAAKSIAQLPIGPAVASVKTPALPKVLKKGPGLPMAVYGLPVLALLAFVALKGKH
jgi:hypothetical protein